MRIEYYYNPSNIYRFVLFIHDSYYSYLGRIAARKERTKWLSRRSDIYKEAPHSLISFYLSSFQNIPERSTSSAPFHHEATTYLQLSSGVKRRLGTHYNA